MPEVNVEINGRKYRMACEEGQEQHLLGLADRFNAYLDGFKGTFGEIGDNRLTVMGGIAVLDELAEAERRIAQLSDEVSKLSNERDEIVREAQDFEGRVARRLNEAARKVEAIATVIDETGAGGQPPQV